jgi:hypothetical protein
VMRTRQETNSAHRSAPFSGLRRRRVAEHGRRHFRRHQNRPDWRCFKPALTGRRRKEPTLPQDQAGKQEAIAVQNADVDVCTVY